MTDEKYNNLMYEAALLEMKNLVPGSPEEERLNFLNIQLEMHDEIQDWKIQYEADRKKLRGQLQTDLSLR